MCGIAGIVSANPRMVQQDRLKKMAGSLAHRGPDGEGYWLNEENTTAFSHRRLSIIDLSDAAAQPMHYAGRYTIIYNGEIYNYIELKNELLKQGFVFHNQSDTEVILAAYQHYGISFLDQLDGMYAFAIWDKLEKKLVLARDRFGEKPLFYAYKNDALFFASEMKALFAAGIYRKANYAAHLFFATTGLAELPTTTTDTFFEGIFQFPPAHYAIVHPDDLQVKAVKYFDIDAEEKTSSLVEATARLKEMLEDSVKKRLRSDVEVGSSLSGGLDSPILALLVSRNNKLPLKTFSGIFPGFERDESVKVKLVAAALGLNSLTITPKADELYDGLTKMLYHQESPIGSSSVFLQYKIYEFAAKNSIKVLLDGQGADELLAGYEKFLPWHLQQLMHREGMTAARKELHQLSSRGYRFHWDIKNYAASYLPAVATKQLMNRSRSQVSNNKIFNWEFTTSFEKKAKSYIEKSQSPLLGQQLKHAVTVQGLPELLRYADRNSMAFGTELRLPYLQHELVQFIFNLPSSFKISEGYTKFILRKSFNKQLPDDIIWQGGKTGFEPPQQEWMQNPAMQDLMQASIQKLSDMQIALPNLSGKLLSPRGAHEQQNEGWRLMIMERLLSQSPN